MLLNVLINVGRVHDDVGRREVSASTVGAVPGCAIIRTESDIVDCHVAKNHWISPMVMELASQLESVTC